MPRITRPAPVTLSSDSEPSDFGNEFAMHELSAPRSLSLRQKTFRAQDFDIKKSSMDLFGRRPLQQDISIEDHGPGGGDIPSDKDAAGAEADDEDEGDPKEIPMKRTESPANGSSP
ncbi:MAG: hypothetical protein M1826_002308 [Phylliscum demangeonii]|nr:MAG: hypothetical protein M1826_002308 [Phylliscum demangeonii]